MRKKTELTLAAMFVILSVTIAFLNQNSVGETPQNGAKISVDPSSIIEQTRQPPFRFRIYISIYNVTNMVSCEFNLSYAPGIFVVNQINKLKVQNQYPSAYTNADDALGYIYVKLIYGQPINLPEQSVQLIEIEFTAISYGYTVLDIHDVYLKDVDGHLIPCEIEDGLVWILKHDVEVIGCAVSTNETYVGKLVNATVIVKNNGDAAENITVTVYAGDQQIVKIEIMNLAPNEIIAEMAVWNTSTLPPSLTPYQIKAEAEPVPYETNTTNNIFIDGKFKLKIVGDINGDGAVNLEDLVLWDSAYNSKPSDPNWNPQADINGDDAVDKEDGELIIQNYRNSLS